MKTRPFLAPAVALALILPSAFAEPSNEEMNNANNPLHPSIGFNLQDQYVGSYYHLPGADSNAGLIRGTMPAKFFGHPQLFRATLPIVTSPDFGAGRDTGLGDLNIFDIFLSQSDGVEIGFGPQLTIPTATEDSLGTGKWQAGLAAMAIKPESWGLLGALVTWQTSFAGDGGRADVNTLQAQPFFIRNFPGGWYFRSTATMSWNLEDDTYYIPVGAGFGKVWKSGSTTCNLFVEPQWTVAYHGPVPKFQVFMGLNLQFPLKVPAQK